MIVARSRRCRRCRCCELVGRVREPVLREASKQPEPRGGWAADGALSRRIVKCGTRCVTEKQQRRAKPRRARSPTSSSSSPTSWQPSSWQPSSSWPQLVLQQKGPVSRTLPPRPNAVRRAQGRSPRYRKQFPSWDAAARRALRVATRGDSACSRLATRRTSCRCTNSCEPCNATSSKCSKTRAARQYIFASRAKNFRAPCRHHDSRDESSRGSRRQFGARKKGNRSASRCAPRAQ